MQLDVVNKVINRLSLSAISLTTLIFTIALVIYYTSHTASGIFDLIVYMPDR